MDPQRQAAEDLVKRSRLGDQNATATIIETRKAAARGSAKAQRSMDLMLAFAQGRMAPSPKDARVNGIFSSALGALRDLVRKTKSADQHAALTFNVVPQVGATLQDAANAAQAISQGPRVGNDVMQATQAAFGGEVPQQAFLLASAESRTAPVLKAAKVADPETKRAIQLGYTLGLARRFQAARAGNIAALSRSAAWELGA